MAEKAESSSKRVTELEKELETVELEKEDIVMEAMKDPGVIDQLQNAVMQAILMKDDEGDDILRVIDNLGVNDKLQNAMMDALLMMDDEDDELKLKENDEEGASQKNLNDQESGQATSVECTKDGQEPNTVTVESGQTFEATSVECKQYSDLFHEGALTEKLQMTLLLRKLPCSSVFEELDVLKELQLLTAVSNNVRTLFGQANGFFSNKLLNPTSIERSYSNASLQSCLVTIVMNITGNDENKVKLKDCPDALPFLVTSLTCPRIETRRLAVSTITGLASKDQNRKIIGESGGIKPLIELIEEGDPESLMYAGYAILNLCKVAENRERAVSEGAVTAVMGKVVGRVRVEEMLQILEMISRHEKAIVEMEEYGILPCLFGILGEDVGEKAKGYCVAIIHTMCHASSAINTRRQMKEVENARETLECLVCTWTKVNELLLKLQEWANEELS